MIFVNFFLNFMTHGDACKITAQKLNESYTGNEIYWNPTSKKE